jgi:hypothetical protein
MMRGGSPSSMINQQRNKSSIFKLPTLTGRTSGKSTVITKEVTKDEIKSVISHYFD